MVQIIADGSFTCYNVERATLYPYDGGKVKVTQNAECSRAPGGFHNTHVTIHTLFEMIGYKVVRSG